MAYDVRGTSRRSPRALDKILVDLYGYFDAPYVKSSRSSSR